MFQGYYKNDEATKETIVDGWLHTGDIGEFDADGYLKITGRKKDIIITAGGKNITPANLEAEIKQSPYVSQAVVIGDRRPFLTALVTLDMEEVAKLAEEKGWPADPAEVAKNPEMREIIQEHIDEINEKFARVEQVKKFEILPADLSQEGGELTPTLKVKRNVVADKYEQDIEALYAGLGRVRFLVVARLLQGHVHRGQVAEAIGARAARRRAPRPTCCPPPTAARARWTPCWRRSAARAAPPPPTTRWGGRSRRATAVLEDGRTAVVEVAAASGLALVAEAERDAEAASSAGTGELIAAAAAAGAPAGAGRRRRQRHDRRRRRRDRGDRGGRRARQGEARGPLRRLGPVRARGRGVRAPEGRRPGRGRPPDRAAQRSRRGAAAGSARQADDRRRGRPLGRPLGGVRRPPRARRGLRARAARLRPPPGAARTARSPARAGSTPRASRASWWARSPAGAARPGPPWT